MTYVSSSNSTQLRVGIPACRPSTQALNALCRRRKNKSRARRKTMPETVTARLIVHLMMLPDDSRDQASLEVTTKRKSLK